MRYGSVCSGIEAASVAWHPLGWEPVWFAEIEPFPCAVLNHHFPEVPNLGDMTSIASRIRDGSLEAPDVLVGGTPCQAFSVAGLRGGLDDPRGALTIAYVDLADAIDSARAIRGLPPAITVWENVPGVLSSKDNAFGCFLGALAGEECELEPEPRPAFGKFSRYWRWCKSTSQHVPSWPDAGCVFGPTRAVAWRVLDAQYFGVAQRRRRVFVVSSARDEFDPAAVLFEFEGLRRDTPPSRETGQTTTHPVAPCLTGSGRGVERGGDRGQDPVVAVMCMAHGQGGAEIADNRSPTLTCNHEAPIAAYGIPGNWIGRKPENGGNAIEPMHDVAPCMTGADRHGVAYAIQGSMIGRSDENGPQGDGINEDVCFTQNCTDRHAVATNMAVRRLTPTECERLQGFPDEYTDIRPKGKDTPDGPRYKALGNSMAVPCMAWIGQRIAMALSL